MPCPAWWIPFVRLPVPGTRVPIAAAVFRIPGMVRISPVTGFIALRALPVHGEAPMHPGT